MAGLGTCRTCNGVVAYGAKACPHCGQSDPAPTPITKRPFAMIVLGIFGLLVGFTVLGSMAGRDDVTPAPPVKAARVLTDPERKAARDEAIGEDAAAGCAVQVEKAMKDPASLQLDHDKTRMNLKADGGTVTIYYRAKNSFAAVVPGATRCTFELNGGTNTRITKLTEVK